MAAAFCLIPQAVQKFKEGLKSLEIDPKKLAAMDSVARRDFLEKYVGKDNAIQVNSLFESKLLLKNQKAGYIAWAKKVGGINPQVRRDLITKIEKLDKVLNPTEEKAFLQDLANTKLGTEITLENAKQISELSKKVQDARKLQQSDTTFKTPEQAKEFARARTELESYVNELKHTNKITLEDFKNPAGIAKSINASMDDSAIFRQGWKTIFTNPLIWQKRARQSFSDIVRTFGGKKVLDEVKIDQYSRENDLNGNYKKMGLAISKDEEAYPSSLVEKVGELPKVGKLTYPITRTYKASEAAYTAFVYRMRMDLADRYLQIAKDQNTDLTDKELQSIGSMVNSLTGRGNLGKYEGSAADATNSVFFSPRNIKSQFDTLGHVITGAGGSNFVRRQAAKNLVKIVLGTAAIMYTANAIKPGSAETDPRSSDFGKIKVGDTRFDITGGAASLITLATRIATQSTKSTTTGKITPINSGEFGAKTGKDVVVDYLTNKLSPVSQVALDLLNQKDRNGNKLTVQGELANLGVPLPAKTLQELLSNPNSANVVASMIADSLGIATNTYSSTQKTWSQNPTKEQQQFLDKVGKESFNQANDKFNTQYSQKLEQLIKSPTYNKLTEDQKSSVLDKIKTNIQKQIFKEYNFKYKQQKQSANDKAKIKELSK